MKLYMILLSCVFFAACRGKEPSAHQAAIKIKNIKAADYFDSQQQIDLVEASERGDTNRMQSLIAQGANANCQGREGMRPLFWTLAKKNLKSFKFLLDIGAEPNVVTEEQPPRESALKLAACMDDPEYLQELLAHGASPNLPVGNAGQTAIFFASVLHKTNNISILLKNKADIDWQDVGKMTPFHHAITDGSFEIALFLYQAGANPLIKDKWGYTPIDSIKKYGSNLYQTASRADKKAYNQLLDEFRNRGLKDSNP